MRRDGGAVVLPDVDIDAQDAAPGPPRIEHGAALRRVAVIQKHQQRRAQDERSAVRDACFDNQIGAAGPDHILEGDNVLRILDDGAVQPREVVTVMMNARLLPPQEAERGQLLVFALGRDFAPAGLDKFVCCIRHG